MVTYQEDKSTKKNKILQNLMIFDILSKGEQKILVSLFDIQQARFYDNKNLIINPRGKYLAKRSSLSVRTVKNFNKKIRNNPILAESIKITRTMKRGRHHLNEYEFSLDLLKAMFLMKFCGSFFNKSYRQKLVEQFSENEEDVIKKLTKKIQKLHHVKPKNCPAITTLFNIPLKEDKVLTKQVQNLNKREEITFKWRDINLKVQQKKYFLNNYPVPVLEKALKDFFFYSNSGNYIGSNFGVFYSRTKYHDWMRGVKNK